MSDNSTRWQRVVSQAGDKPSFRARQTTSDVPPPTRKRVRASREVEQSERITFWWTVAVLILSAIAGLLTWLVFFT